MFIDTHKVISKAIIKSQHCQRNWDLSRSIPEEDMKLIEMAATQCPSKQNIAHYNVHFITNRELIEKIHAETDGFTYNYQPKQTTTNTQTLANLLIVFEALPLQSKLGDKTRNDQTYELAKNENVQVNTWLLEKDLNMAIGIAAGYVNMVSTLLGYSTGCCACFNPQGVQNILKTENNIALLMGVGFSDPTLNRRVHHNDHSFIFNTLKKQPINVTYYK